MFDQSNFMLNFPIVYIFKSWFNSDSNDSNLQIDFVSKIKVNNKYFSWYERSFVHRF